MSGRVEQTHNAADTDNSELASAGSSTAAASSGCCCLAGSEEVDDEGFCQGCGIRVVRSLLDRTEQELSLGAAAVSDRGRVRARNEDCFSLLTSARGTALIVCDGVSSTKSPELASALVCTVVSETLQTALTAVGAMEAPTLLQRAVQGAATQLQQHRVRKCGEDEQPSTTVVAALVMDNSMTVSWAGDSRAYWITLHEAVQLTRDHAATTEGAFMNGDDGHHNSAHAITRWIGADGDGGELETVKWEAQEEGFLLLCSDGLWRYLPETAALHETFWQCAQASCQALEIAKELVAYANQQGGHDNITVALFHIQL